MEGRIGLFYNKMWAKCPSSLFLFLSAGQQLFRIKMGGCAIWVSNAYGLQQKKNRKEKRGQWWEIILGEVLHFAEFSIHFNSTQFLIKSQWPIKRWRQMDSLKFAAFGRVIKWPLKSHLLGVKGMGFAQLRWRSTDWNWPVFRWWSGLGIEWRKWAVHF